MILITGASGNIGQRVTQRLCGKVPLRLMVRNKTKIRPLPNTEIVVADYGEPTSLMPAFRGVEVAFIVSGYAEPGKRSVLHGHAIRAAADAGVKHLVYLSFQGASPTSHFPMSRDHYETEQHLRRSGVPYTALRDNFYLDLLPEMFDAKTGVVRGPAGEGAAAWVAREDVAAVAARVLENPSAWTGVYDVTGPEAISFADAARRLSTVFGRSFRYEAESVEAGRVWRARLGAPAWEVETWLGSYRAIAEGELVAPSDTVQLITGQAPQSLEFYLGKATYPAHA
jgi:NAD(P)H dehydrogenase (quinone)